MNLRCRITPGKTGAIFLTRLAVVLVVALFASGRAEGASVVINEVDFQPPDKRPLEFVELYNPGSQTVPLAGWTLNKFFFPTNTVIGSNSFLVVASDPVAFQKEFGFAPLGPLLLKLRHSTSSLRLIDNHAQFVDEVHYGVGFPWPTATGGGGSSLERVHPGLPGDSPSSWRSSGFPVTTTRRVPFPGLDQPKSLVVPAWQRPTPGARNSVFTEEPPPAILGIGHVPQQPKSGEPVTVSVKVTTLGKAQLTNVTLRIQVVEPGKYIRYTDHAYQHDWQDFPMQLSDGATGPEFVATIPGQTQQHRRLVRYRVVARGQTGHAVEIPYADDQVPNFAWFVYDGLPPWKGASSPGKTPALTFSPEMLNTLPTYHLIARAEDVSHSQWDGAFNRQPFFGTLVYEDKVYDHIRFHNRGQGSTYLAGKNKWALRFNRGHPFAARDDYGRAYEHPWHGVELNACASPWVQMNRGMAGLDEALAFRSYQLADVPAANTHWLQWRVIQNAQESPPSNQYQTDLWGLYLAVQPMEGPWLDELGLPAGNLYSLQSGRKYLARGMPSDNSDWERFSRAIQGRHNETWWRAHLNIPVLCSFHALNRLLSNVDLRESANHGFYHAPDERWVPVPWDNDMMFIPHSHQSGVIYPVSSLEIPALRLEYKNRAREILDLFVSDSATNGGQFAQLVNEFALILCPPGQIRTWPELDMAMWNYHPRSYTRGEFYVNPYTRGWSGESFRRVLDTADFAGFCRYIVNFCTDSRPQKDYEPDDNNPVGYGWGYLSWEAKDENIPARPTITYTGPARFPATNLVFGVSPFVSPVKGGKPGASFAALQWRVAEMRAPGLAGYQAGQPWAYELKASWQSGELSQAEPVFTFPMEVCKPAHTYRARARYKDNAGRWSHWSLPAQFVPK